jgi:hypothetical protein
MSVVDDFQKAKAAIDEAIYEAIDRKGYVPCHMATATRNATITGVLGVACYSKTDVCHSSPLPAGVTTASNPTPGDASTSVVHQQSAGMMLLGAL